MHIGKLYRTTTATTVWRFIDDHSPGSNRNDDWYWCRKQLVEAGYVGLLVNKTTTSVSICEFLDRDGASFRIYLNPTNTKSNFDGFFEEVAVEP